MPAPRALLALLAATSALSGTFVIACGGRRLAPPKTTPLPAPGGPSTAGHTWTVDPARSKVNIHLASSGLVGHTHLFQPDRYRGSIRFDPADLANVGVDLSFAADSLRDHQTEISEDDRRNKIEPTARGPEVLDAARYPEVRFIGLRLAHAKKTAPGGSDEGLTGSLIGVLALHGRHRPVEVPITARWARGALKATGEVVFRQTDFGIDPYSRMLGIVAVADEIKVAFDLTALEDVPESPAAPVPTEAPAAPAQDAPTPAASSSS